MGRVFANGSADRGSISGRVIPKTLKMVLDTSLLNTQQYWIRIKGKVEQSRERSSALLYNSESSGQLRSPTLLFNNLSISVFWYLYINLRIFIIYLSILYPSIWYIRNFLRPFISLFLFLFLFLSLFIYIYIYVSFNIFISISVCPYLSIYPVFWFLHICLSLFLSFFLSFFNYQSILVF